MGRESKCLISIRIRDRTMDSFRDFYDSMVKNILHQIFTTKIKINEKTLLNLGFKR